MGTIDKLRRLHEEVCGAWRKQLEPNICESEAELLNFGFMLLEMLVVRSDKHWLSPEDTNREMIFTIARYVRRVKAEFPDERAIDIAGDK